MTNWFKVARADRDKIITHCGEKSPGVLAVWLAFCDLANQARASSFTSSGAEIARVAGVSRRTVERSLPIIRDLGLASWEHTTNRDTGGLEANQYTLPTFPPTATMAEPLPSDCRHPTAKDEAQSWRSLDRKTEKKETHSNGHLTPSARISVEKNLERWRKQERDLKAEISERYIRVSCPEKVGELKSLQSRIAEAESRLEASR